MFASRSEILFTALFYDAVSNAALAMLAFFAYGFNKKSITLTQVGIGSPNLNKMKCQTFF